MGSDSNDCLTADESRKPRRNKSEREKPSFAIVKKILKIHDERLYQANVTTMKELSERKHAHTPGAARFHNIAKASNASNERTETRQEDVFDFYAVEKTNKTPTDYLHINQDVNSFAKNFERIRQILRETKFLRTHTTMMTTLSQHQISESLTPTRNASLPSHGHSIRRRVRPKEQKQDQDQDQDKYKDKDKDRNRKKDRDRERDKDKDKDEERGWTHSAIELPIIGKTIQRPVDWVEQPQPELSRRRFRQKEKISAGDLRTIRARHKSRQTLKILSTTVYADSHG